MTAVVCENHGNMEQSLVDTEDEFVKKCPNCGKDTRDMFDDIDDIDPTTRVSQQPHGKATTYCNMCQGFTESDQHGCVYHQQVLHGEEGPYLRYDEFDQDGC